MTFRFNPFAAEFKPKPEILDTGTVAQTNNAQEQPKKQLVKTEPLLCNNPPDNSVVFKKEEKKGKWKVVTVNKWPQLEHYRNTTNRVKKFVAEQKLNPVGGKNKLTIYQLLSMNEISGDAKFLEHLATKNSVRLKGGFAIFAVAVTANLLSPLRVKDLDFEVLYQQHYQVRKLLLDTCGWNFQPHPNNLPFFNESYDKFQKGSEKDQKDPFSCQFTFGNMKKYQSIDPFYWTRLRLDIYFVDGSIYCRPEQANLLQSVQSQLKQKKFKVDWKMFRTHPNVINGIGRLVKYFYQLQHQGYQLNTDTGDIIDKDIKDYAKNKIIHNDLFGDLAILLDHFYHCSIISEKQKEYNDKWIQKLTRLIRIVVKEINYKITGSHTDQTKLNELVENQFLKNLRDLASQNKPKPNIYNVITQYFNGLGGKNNLANTTSPDNTPPAETKSIPVSDYSASSKNQEEAKKPTTSLDDSVVSNHLLSNGTSGTFAVAEVGTNKPNKTANQTMKIYR